MAKKNSLSAAPPNAQYETAVDRLTRLLKNAEQNVAKRLKKTTTARRRAAKIYDASKTRKLAVEYLERSITNFDALVDEGLHHWKFQDSVDEAQLKRALGRGGDTEALLASSSSLRRLAGIAMMDAVRRFAGDMSLKPARTWMFITLLDDSGNALEREPEFYIPAFRRKVDKLLRVAKLQGITVLEIQALHDFPRRGHGGTLMLHANVLAWTDEPFDKKTISKAIKGTGWLRSALNASTVEIVELKQTRGELAWRCYYMFKAPFLMKRARWNPKSPPPRLSLEQVKARPDIAVRIAEGLSQLKWTDLVFAVGRDATAVKDGWVAKLKLAQKSVAARTRLRSDYDVAELWARTRALNETTKQKARPTTRRQPYVFLKTGKRRGPTAWQRIAAVRLEELRCRRSDCARRHKAALSKP